MINLYNTLTKKIEEFTPGADGIVRMYSCGPTVYDFAHIGNLRSFITADLLYRALSAEFGADKVRWVMNITDIEDKIIKNTVTKYGNDATVANLQEFTDSFHKQFIDDLKSINVSVENIQFIKVTDVIPQIQTFILELIEKGYAYIADDGSTYFSIEKYQADFKDYGTLVGEKFLEGKQVGARVKVDEYDKDNLSDFALWKAHHSDDGNIFWDHPTLGKGRPGWHIECSVINRVAFGDVSTDIHTGGVDLVFPHHTNEIAQSQPIYNPFSRHWFHSEHLLVDGKKMSKSAKNFYTLKDIEAKGYNGDDLRYLFLQSHYKTQQNFTWDSLQAAHTSLRRLSELSQNSSAGDELDMSAITHDLDTPKLLAEAWGNIARANISKIIAVLGIKISSGDHNPIPEQVATLVEQRKTAREQKDFDLSDQLRDQITELGYEVKDTQSGQVVIKIKK